MTARLMEVGVLGPIEARDTAGTALPVPRGRPLTLLALLLTRRGEVVPADAAVAALWPGQPPQDPRNALQLALSRLRRALAGGGQDGPGVVAGLAGGYVLRLPAGSVDADRFETLVQAGRGQLDRNEAADAAGTLRRALGLWRGQALADVRDEPFAQQEISRLDELRMAALTGRVDADLALGRHAQLVGDLKALAAEHPLRERLRAQLMLALYGSGRQADALAVYRDTRRMLIAELGVEPSAELREAHQLVLRHGDLPGRAAPVPRAVALVPGPAPAPEAARRRPVTCVAAVPPQAGGGLAPADPEAVRTVLLSLQARMSGAVAEFHGALHDGSAGAVTGVFGWPVAREDDVLKAVAAAAAIAAVPDGLAPGVGVVTGEAVAPPEAGAPFLFGDLAEQAAALARRAGPGQVLVAAPAWQLVAHAAQGSPAAEGTAVALASIDPSAAAVRRSAGGPYLGRDAELGLLSRALASVAASQAGQLITVTGEPGAGKTRLSLEFERLARPGAVVLRGRCRPPGEDVPYRPFQEIIEQASAGSRPADWLARTGVTAGAVQAVLAMLGHGQQRTSGPLPWAIGQVLAAVAGPHPAVLVIDDVQNAAPEAAELLDGLAAPLQQVPVLVVCLARPELQQVLPLWGRGWEQAATVALRPLDETHSRALLARLTGPPGAAAGDIDGGLPAGTANQVIATAGGNPLFLEQLTRHLREQPGSQVTVPPALHGLLASRLDLLSTAERTILERGAIEGDVFHQEAVASGRGPGGAAAVTGPVLDQVLDALLRRDLIVPVASGFGGRPAFGFRHRLIREAAYAMLTRADRAALHEQHAAWLAGLIPPAPASAELQAAHLERAHGHLTAIGDPGNQADLIAARAGPLLTAAAGRAHRRGELTAEIGLLDRARQMLAPQPVAAAGLLPILASALAEAGTFGRAAEVAEAGARAGLELGLPAVRWRSVVERERARLYADPGAADIATALTAVRQATRVFTTLGDDLGLARSYYLRAELLWMKGQPDSALRQCERQVRHARQAGAGFEAAVGQTYLAWSLVDGCTPVRQGLRRLTGLIAEAGDDPVARLGLVGFMAVLRSMAGEPDADALMRQSRRGLADLGLNMTGAAMAIFDARMRLRAGDYPGAEQAVSEALRTGQQAGDRWVQSTALADLAHVLLAQGRHEDAVRAVKAIDTAPAPRDTEWRVRRLTAQSALAALSASHATAIRRADAAVAAAEGTQFLMLRCHAQATRAAVLRRAGRAAEAAAAQSAAQALARAKGDITLLTGDDAAASGGNPG
jgi:DNA-binding SARP family transcriptional activator